MAINFKVFTKFGGKDDVSDKFDRMSKNAKQFGRDSSKAFSRASKGAAGFKSVMGGILAAGVVTRGLDLLKSGLMAAGTEFVAFDDAITASSAKFKGLDLTTAQGQKTLEALGKTARKVGAETKFSATEAAQGLDFYATAGFNAEQAMAVLAPTAKLAMAANLDLARTSDIASDSLGAFGLMTKDSTQLQANFTRMSDVMAKTMTSTNTSMEDMFEAVKKGAPTFTATGQSLETFNALMGTMANSGVKGSEAGTQLRNVMLRLAKPTAEAQDALDALGVSTRDKQGNFRDVIDIMGDFEKGMEGLGDAERAAALSTIFGQRAITGVNLLLQEGSENLRTFRTDLENASGTTEDMADIMSKSLGNQLLSLKSAAIEVGFQFFEAFSGEGSTAIQTFTEFLRNVDMTPLINGIKSVAGFFGNIFSRLIEIGESTGVFDKIGEAVTQLQPTFDMLKDVVSTVFDVLSDAGVFELIGKMFGNLIDAVVMFARVIGWMWENVAKPIFTAFGELLKPIITFFNAIADSQGVVFGAISDVFKKGGKADQIKAAGATAPAAAGVNYNLSTAAFGQQQQQAPQRQAPNRVQVESRQQVDVGGRIDIAGAPAGSTATPNKGANIDWRMMGDPRQSYYRQAG